MNEAKTKKKESAFERRCNKAAEDVGVTVFFVLDEPTRPPFEDDGSLHVIHRGTRAIFDVGWGQSLEGKEQNEHTKKVLIALGMEKSIGESTLVEEEEENDGDRCPHRGRSDHD